MNAILWGSGPFATVTVNATLAIHNSNLTDVRIERLCFYL